MKKGLWKGAFRTLSWNYIKQQLWFMKNQAQEMGWLGAYKTSAPVANARATEKSILRRLVTTNKKRVQDSAVLSSSWCYSGTWYASTTQDDYWIGTLQLTVKQEQKNGGYKIGKTYSFHNFPLTSWAMMKAALGRDGTGAGTVYWKTYIRGWRSGKETPASRWSEQVLVKGRY